MTRKCLFCFPLRLGNIIFGYVCIVIGIAVLAYHLYHIGVSLVTDNYHELEKRFVNWERLEAIFGQRKDVIVTAVTLIYHTSYVIVGFLLFLFSALFTCGAYNANYCLVMTFFVYSFFHLFLTVGLIVWEATSGGWLQLALIIIFDVLLIICLFSVNYLMEAIRTGNIYSRPGEVYYKY